MSKETLTIEQLAPYLPYGLKIQTSHGLHVMNSEVDRFSDDPNISIRAVINNHDQYKPVLRNLSDLTKEIEHNGEKFVPILRIFHEAGIIHEFDVLEYINEKEKDYSPSKYGVNDRTLSFWYEPEYQLFMYEGDEEIPALHQYTLHTKLFEYHFDIFGILEKNLAIDLNTIQ